MQNHKPYELYITGLGVTSAIGQGKDDFISALLKGQHAFDVMQRPGRQCRLKSDNGEDVPVLRSSFLGAEIDALSFPATIPKRVLRTATYSGQVALVTLNEAWRDAELHDADPYRIGLVVGGSNIQQRDLVLTQEKYKNKFYYLRPTYGVSFLDTDICGLCTELFGIRGFAYTIGGASASGQIAFVQAIQAVLSGQVDICIAMGALMDLSFWECQGFRALGAMGSIRYSKEPAEACRPFDADRDGFIYGESCGAVVVESSNTLRRKEVQPYARILGWAVGMDGNRNPNPSLPGEIRAIDNALQQARLQSHEIDYINPHGTGSVIGDEIELQAIDHHNFRNAYLNATKSITGHGLSSAGTVELIATLLQMKEGRLHPTRNLHNPIKSSLNWVRHQSTCHDMKNALNLSMGFGGINSVLCVQNSKYC